MKKILLVICSMSILYSNEMIVSDMFQVKGLPLRNITISGNGEECMVTYGAHTNVNNTELFNTDCLKITNSKGINIFCTKNKKICKTDMEVENALLRTINTKSNKHQFSQKREQPLYEEFELIISPYDDIGTTYERNEFKKRHIGNVYKFTGTISNVESKYEFSMKINAWQYVTIKGNLNIDAVLNAHKTGEVISIPCRLTYVGTGIVVPHEAQLIR